MADRVAITTAADRTSRLADLARHHGLVPIPLPCIEVFPATRTVLEKARALAVAADWLLITSPRAVSAVWSGGGMPPAPVASVGPATTAAIEAAGGRVQLVGDAGGQSVVRQLAHMVDGASVFFPHATGAGESSIAALERAGAQVSAVAVYETRPTPPGPEPVEAAAFGSPSAVSGWLLSRLLDELEVVAAIGETTARALLEAGRAPQVVPPHPDFEDLMARLADHLRQRSPI
ncbi:MAG: uroporphyrinogen-III synthase [Acidimicrobiia bacterium]